MAGYYTESNYENAVLQLLNEGLGYTYVYGPDVERDYHSPLYEDVLLPALQRINKGLPLDAINEAIYKLKNFESGSLLQKNMTFTDYLQNGISVKYFVNGEERSTLVYLVDFKNLANNDFTVANQWTFIENSEKRPDVILFINGLPLVVVELKSPSREETDASDAYRQLRNYMYEIPSMFIYNEVCVMSDMTTSKAGTITSGEDRFMEWKTTDGSYENTQYAAFDTFFEGLFEKNRFLDILKNFICFNVDGEKTFKVLAAYHQYFAVKKAIASTQKATVTDGKGGVFWHTQGSGKSLSMVFYAHYLQEALESPTIVVITDRNDLDDQLYGQFARCKDFLRQTPQHAQSRTHLKELLANRQANGIIFTTMQKFEENDEPLSERRNIIVMADEAHRSQYGLTEKVVVRQKEDGEVEAKTIIGTARIIRDRLPKATYIGFTGTPISSKDRSTREVFGDYIDIYDMTQAVEDGATVPVYYESRLLKLDLDDDTLRLLDSEYDKLAEEGAEEQDIKRSKDENARLHALLSAPQTIDTLCKDIIDHYENNRADLLTGKAMIVAIDRATGIDIYKKLIELRPQWKEIIAVVMTQGNQDPVEWNDIIGSGARKEELARQFKDNNSSLKIAIVVDMWLTGFDVPSLATMYVYKPMKGHNLMQAIARVNRVFPEKSGGLVVDYIGIAKALKKAMHDYTGRDKKRFGDPNIKTTAYQQFVSALKRCRECLNGYDYSAFSDCSNLQRANLIRGGVNVLLDKNNLVPSEPAAQDKVSSEAQKVFMEESKRLSQAASLCRSLLTPAERFEEAYFEAVRTLLSRLSGNKQITRKIIDERITQLLKVAIKADGVVEILNTKGSEFSLFDENFLKEIAEMKEKNFALELLKRLLEEHIKKHAKKRMVEAEKFSEMLDARLAEYLRGLISNEEVIKELLKMAQELKANAEQASELGLTEEEQAFYDALTKPQAVRDFYENDQLVAMAKELTEALRSSKTIDWRQKESARAKMRSLVKRLLKKYKYPPEEQEAALETVIRQCELYADSDDES